MSLTFGSLFTGIGGIDLGFIRAGLVQRWVCEREPVAQHLLQHLFPGVPCHDDVADGAGFEPVDVVAGGFPCQPTSNAGLRLGDADSRWGWPLMERAVRGLRPRFVVVENPTGLLSRGIEEVVGGLAALGYVGEWDCVPAAAVGAPHQRDRVFVVAYPPGLGLEGRVFEPKETWKAFSVSPGHAWWASEPALARVAVGVPGSLDRMWLLGNSVSPAVSEIVGQRLMKVAASVPETAFPTGG